MNRSTHTPQYKLVCSYLRDARKKKGLTQAVLAKKLGRQQSFVAKYETCERRIDIIELKVIADAIGVELRELLEFL
jgi:transcriptional regulator with XRE-family HTH domain